MLVPLRLVLARTRRVLSLLLRSFRLRLSFRLLRPRRALLLPCTELVGLALLRLFALLHRRGLSNQGMLRSRHILPV